MIAVLPHKANLCGMNRSLRRNRLFIWQCLEGSHRILRHRCNCFGVNALLFSFTSALSLFAFPGGIVSFRPAVAQRLGARRQARSGLLDSLGWKPKVRGLRAMCVSP